MPTMMIPPIFVLVPILILGVIDGLRRGWKDELWALGGLMLSAVIVARPDTILLPFLERFISVFLRAFQELLGRDTSGPSFVFPANVRFTVVVLSFLTLAAGSYAVGHLLGKGEISKGIMRLLGGLVGAVNLVIITSWLATQFFAKRDDGLARVSIPSFTGREVVFGNPTANNLLASWQGLVGILLVIILIVFLLNRARVLR